jgi:penicillin-binding protein 1C
VAVGFTPEFTVAVWVGNGDGSPMRGITGVTGAAPLLNAMFRKLQRERGVTWFGRPAGVREYRIHQLLGKQLDPERVNNRQKAELVREFSASPPPTAEDRDFDSEGRVQLSADYADWWKAGGSALAGRATLQVVGDATLKILYPPPGTIIYLDGSIPSEYQQLRASATNPLIWSSPSLPSGQAPGHFGLLPGRHDLSARDPASGRTLHTWIEVREL